MTTELEQQEQDLIPPAVRRRIEEMSKFTTPDPNAAPEEKAPVAATPETPEEAPAGTPPPETKKEEAAPAEPTTFAEVATEEMTKEQRYKIMEGMQKAAGRELRQARADANALRGEVEALKEQLSARPTAHVQPAAAPATPDVEDADLVEAFGANNITGLEKRMEHYLRKRGFVVTQDLQQVQSQVGQVRQTIDATAHAQFETDMDGYTENQWKAINVDPRFIAWTGEPEGRTGIPRIEFMKKLLAEQNAPMLAQYFVDFNAEVGAAPAAPPKAPALDKKKFAAPPARSTAGAPLTEDKPTVKMSEFTKFSADVRAGKYTSDDPVAHLALQKKMAAEQSRLDAAQRSGLVVQG